MSEDKNAAIQRMQLIRKVVLFVLIIRRGHPGCLQPDPEG